MKFINFVPLSQAEENELMQILILNIGELVQVETRPRQWVAGKGMGVVKTLPDAYLFIDGGSIASFGHMKNLGDDLLVAGTGKKLKTIDASGRMVFPCWCDSHTHIVYPASREQEFVDKIKGLDYEEIARRGGGILNTARKLAGMPEGELFRLALARIDEMIRMGTGALEIKSGYGLTPSAELKMLRVIRKLKESSAVTIRATFLGAHAVPDAFRSDRKAYVDQVIGEMIPVVAAEGLADYIDVFCDRGFFSVEDTDRILNSGMKHGLRPKIHANELDFSGGVEVGVKYNALSVDHLEHSGEDEIECLRGTDTMPTVLPGASFFLGLPYAPVRKMIDAGLPVALASDYNPGSSPSGNMQFIQSLACIHYRMLPEEALNAATLNGAYAMGLQDELGTIAVGKKANIFISKPIPSLAFMPYAYGSNKVDTVILNGKIYDGV